MLKVHVDLEIAEPLDLRDKYAAHIARLFLSCFGEKISLRKRKPQIPVKIEPGTKPAEGQQKSSPPADEKETDHEISSSQCAVCRSKVGKVLFPYYSNTKLR